MEERSAEERSEEGEQKHDTIIRGGVEDDQSCASKMSKKDSFQ